MKRRRRAFFQVLLQYMHSLGLDHQNRSHFPVSHCFPVTMLRKRNRSVHKDPMGDAIEGDVQKERRSSIFSIPGFFVGSSCKAPSENDAPSPTSPLDFRILPSICSKVGLGIIESLEEHRRNGRILRSSDSFLFGPKRKIKASSPVLESGDAAHGKMQFFSLDSGRSMQVPSGSSVNFGSGGSSSSSHHPRIRSYSLSDDFLSFCRFCYKKLDGKDIYMYRGEKAFCSLGCRSGEMVREEEMEKKAMNDPIKNTDLRDNNHHHPLQVPFHIHAFEI